MKVKFWYEDELEELCVPLKDIHYLIDLVKEGGYEDSNGAIYVFDSYRVEHNYTLFIYLKIDET